MSGRLKDLLYNDTKRRWKLLGGSIIVMAFVGLVAQSIGASLGVAQSWAAVAGLVALVGQAFRFMNNPRPKLPRSARKSEELSRLDLPKLYKPLMILGVTGVLTFLAVEATPFLWGTAVNKKLQLILESPPTAERASETKRVIQFARDSHANLRADLIATAVLQADQKPESWPEYIALVSYKYGQNLHGPQDFVQHGGPIPTVIDGMNCNDCSLGGTIAYHGGRVQLKDTVFPDAHFEITQNDNGKKFAQALLSARGGSVNFSTE